MTDILDEAHAQVGLVALNANAALTGKVFDGKVPDPTPTPPYVLVYILVSRPRDGVGTSLGAEQVTITTTYMCHCVGLSAALARAVGMQVRSSLLNLRPVIPGRICSPIKQDDVQPPDRDESTGTLVMDLVATYSFVSVG